jgi:hypothetical protein
MDLILNQKKLSLEERIEEKNKILKKHGDKYVCVFLGSNFRMKKGKYLVERKSSISFLLKKISSIEELTCPLYLFSLDKETNYVSQSISENALVEDVIRWHQEQDGNLYLYVSNSKETKKLITVYVTLKDDGNTKFLVDYDTTVSYILAKIRMQKKLNSQEGYFMFLTNAEKTELPIKLLTGNMLLTDLKKEQGLEDLYLYASKENTFGCATSTLSMFPKNSL